MYLQLDGIPGESKGSNHLDWIEVVSFNWGMSRPATAAGQGSGSPSVHTQVQDFTFSHVLDKASPLLMSGCAQGKPIKEATFDLCHPGAGGPIFYELKMTNILVSSINLSGVTPSNKPLENVNLKVAKIQWSYWAQNPDGSRGNAITGSYDLTAGS